MSSIEIKDLTVEYEELSDMELESVAGGKGRSFLMDAVEWVNGVLKNKGVTVGPGVVGGGIKDGGAYVTYTGQW